MADRILVLGANPGHLRIELPGLPVEERILQNGAHTALVDLIYRIMTSVHEDVSALLSREVPQAKTGPLVTVPPRPYQILPHVSIGDVAGLIELVHARGGKEDLYQLGCHLHLEVDDLLPLVEVADLLDLAETGDGDSVLTPQGKALLKLEYSKKSEFSVTKHLLISAFFVKSSKRWKLLLGIPCQKNTFCVC